MDEWDEVRAVIQAATVIGSIEQHIAPHMDHPWEKIGRCIYCGPCGTRLYQGTIPRGHPIFDTPKPKRQSQADQMRDRWGKS